MKNEALILAIVTLFPIASCKEKDGVDPVILTLTDDEKTDLLYLREEEKLARDVYLFSSAKYGTQIFANISWSEQKHMDEVLTLLIKYGISDPASKDTGVFNDAVLQQLYVDLTLKSEKSLADALEVGATIEDLDIRDIKVNIGRTTKSDLVDVYDKLQCGARNHMRAYYNQLKNEGITYEPKYLSQDELDAILEGSHEGCGN